LPSKGLLIGALFPGITDFVPQTFKESSFTFYIDLDWGPKTGHSAAKGFGDERQLA